MSSSKIIPGNPSTFDATQENAGPGDIVVDPTGTAAVPGIVVRTGGSGRSNQSVFVVGGPYTPPAADVITVNTALSSGAGNRRVRFTVTQGGPAAANRQASLAVEADDAGLFAVDVGAGIELLTSLGGHWLGRATAGGLVEFEMDGPTGTTIAWVFSTGGATGSVASGSTTIP